MEIRLQRVIYSDRMTALSSLSAPTSNPCLNLLNHISFILTWSSPLSIPCCRRQLLACLLKVETHRYQFHNHGRCLGGNWERLAYQIYLGSRCGHQHDSKSSEREQMARLLLGDVKKLSG